MLPFLPRVSIEIIKDTAGYWYYTIKTSDFSYVTIIQSCWKHTNTKPMDVYYIPDVWMYLLEHMAFFHLIKIKFKPDSWRNSCFIDGSYVTESGDLMRMLNITHAHRHISSVYLFWIRDYNVLIKYWLSLIICL